MIAITPEIIAKLIFCFSNLRYFEQQNDIDKDGDSREIMRLAQARADELLHEIGCTGYKSLQEIYEQVLIDYLKQAV